MTMLAVFGVYRPLASLRRIVETLIAECEQLAADEKETGT